jgi:hypothetical protein
MGGHCIPKISKKMKKGSFTQKGRAHDDGASDACSQLNPQSATAVDQPSPCRLPF